MTKLEDIIQRQISKFGPINIAEYMTLCLTHPQFGYYTQQEPFGASGDFITAPEISQMFGELIGLKLANAWMEQGNPAKITLLELGPGRGTLMEDLLRATRNIPDFHNAINLHFLEVSPRLQTILSKKLNTHPITFISTLDELPDAPLYFIANEFFDALPIHQYENTENGWQERVIGMKNDALVFGLSDITNENVCLPIDSKTGTIIEKRPSASALLTPLSETIAQYGGFGMIFDYGELELSGDSFQALHAHKSVSPLYKSGETDLTSHVDFLDLINASSACQHEFKTQGVFLEETGITIRAQQLAENLNGDAKEMHIFAFKRLTHPDEMGQLFKSLMLTPKSED